MGGTAVRSGHGPSPAWRLDEAASAGRENLDPAHVARNDDKEDIDEHVWDEHSTFTWLLEPMIERSGFRIERADHSADGILAAYIARAI
jgi:hypothetical protein